MSKWSRAWGVFQCSHAEKKVLFGSLSREDFRQKARERGCLLSKTIDNQFPKIFNSVIFFCGGEGGQGDQVMTWAAERSD